MDFTCRNLHWRGMRHRQDVRHAVWFAEMYLFTKLQAARRSPSEGSRVWYGRRFVQVPLPAKKEIVSHPRPIVGSGLSRTVSE